MQEIICILDKSASMQGVADEALGGFNKFVKEQQEVGEANLTVIWFDNTWSVGYEGNLKDAPKFTEWPSGGMTALRDGIGKTFMHVEERFAKEQPEKVVMAILTDGFDNTSREFTQEAVADLIKHHEDKYGWDVLFLAADQNAWAVAQTFNIKANKSFDYQSMNTVGGMDLYSSSVKAFRTA